MKRWRYLFVVCCLAHQAAAQSVTESKGSTNSILLNGSAITVKITDPSIRLDWQKSDLFKNNRNNGYIAGLSARGENESGVSGVFKSGDMVPAGRITAVAGLTFSNNVNQSAEKERENARNKEKEIRDELSKLILIKDELKKADQDTTAIKAMITGITERELKPLLQQEVKAAGKTTAIAFHKTTAFVFGGINAKSFKRFTGYDANNLLNSFTDQDFRGGFAGAGVNYQYRNLQFGATAAYARADNQSLLTEGDYLYQQTTTVNNQVVVESQEIKAFGGPYSTAGYCLLNADFIGNFALDAISNAEQPRNYMLINPYFHAKIGSSNKRLLPNTTDIGMGLYVFNNKSMLLGGIFVELPDVGNNIQKSVFGTAGSTKPALQRLSFGIVTRLNLHSFMKLSDL